MQDFSQQSSKKAYALFTFITRSARLNPLPRAARCKSPLGCLLIAHEVWSLSAFPHPGKFCELRDFVYGQNLCVFYAKFTPPKAERLQLVYAPLITTGKEAADLKFIIMASAPQSNGVTRAYGKAVQIAQHLEAVCEEYDIKEDFDNKHGAPNAAAPKVFMKYFFVNTKTGEKSGEMLTMVTLDEDAPVEGE